MAASLLSIGACVFMLAVAAPATTATSPATPPARLDHLLIGASDLDRAVAEFERITGVRPVYGGKHPAGTHNALVSLGEGLYLELIAVQPGVAPPPFFGQLPKLEKLTPIGWAVSVPDAQAARQQLEAVGFRVSELRPGSRATPVGSTLRWHTFELQDHLTGGPFFLSWAPDSAHPSATSPSGCQLDSFTVSGPDAESLSRLLSKLALPVHVTKADAEQLKVSLLCPKGRIVFDMIPGQLRPDA
jgi:catechol 2,3-dioxygenase-like lactoylglutathione lyase family enzyme